MYPAILRFAFLSAAAIGCIAITLVPHWRDLVAQDYGFGAGVSPPRDDIPGQGPEGDQSPEGDSGQGPEDTSEPGADDMPGQGAEDMSEQGAEKEKEAVEKRLKETREERGDDLLAGRVGVFITGTYGETDRRTTQRENGFDAELSGVTFGADYRLSRKAVVGGALTYQKNDTTYDDRIGSLDSETYGVTAYLGTAPSDTSFLDFMVGYGNLDYKNRRNVFATVAPSTAAPIVDVARSNYDGYRLTAGVSGGMDWISGPFSYGPRASLDYLYTDVDESVETSGGASAARVGSYSKDSIKLKLGVGGSHASSFTWGVLSTQASFSYVREFADDAVRIKITNIATGDQSSSLTDEPDRDTFLGTIGAAVIRPNGVTIFGNLEQLFGHSYMDRWTANAGVRLEF